MLKLRVSSLEKEGVYQASKWLKIPVLLDGLEMESLLKSLDKHWIFRCGFSNGEAMEDSFFVSEYTRWIDGLKKKQIPTDEELRHLLASYMTDDLDSLWLQKIASKENEYLIKVRQPVIQMQAHFVHFSTVDHEFRSMSIGKDSIFWGILFSYPQVVQDAKTMDICSIKPSRLFSQLREWVRENTRPTPFLVDGIKKNVPIRIGKECFSWISEHPDLNAKGLKIYGCV